jgi:hypothetical protein
MRIKTSVIISVLLLLLSCHPGSEPEGESYDLHAGYIQIVMFHMEQRCVSCDAVEEETLRMLEGAYRDAFDAGSIKFIPLNYQSENGKKAAELLRATGQTLYVVKGDSITNLTSAAFMFAHTHPEYYHEALREVLDKYLK